MERGAQGNDGPGDGDRRTSGSSSGASGVAHSGTAGRRRKGSRASSTVMPVTSDVLGSLGHDLSSSADGATGTLVPSATLGRASTATARVTQTQATTATLGSAHETASSSSGPSMSSSPFFHDNVLLGASLDRSAGATAVVGPHRPAFWTKSMQRPGNAAVMSVGSHASHRLSAGPNTSDGADRWTGSNTHLGSETSGGRDAGAGSTASSDTRSILWSFFRRSHSPGVTAASSTRDAPGRMSVAGVSETHGHRASAATTGWKRLTIANPNDVGHLAEQLQAALFQAPQGSTSEQRPSWPTLPAAGLQPRKSQTPMSNSVEPEHTHEKQSMTQLYPSSVHGSLGEAAFPRRGGGSSHGSMSAGVPVRPPGSTHDRALIPSKTHGAGDSPKYSTDTLGRRRSAEGTGGSGNMRRATGDGHPARATAGEGLGKRWHSYEALMRQMQQSLRRTLVARTSPIHAHILLNNVYYIFLLAMAYLSPDWAGIVSVGMLGGAILLSQQLGLYQLLLWNGIIGTPSAVLYVQIITFLAVLVTIKGADSLAVMQTTPWLLLTILQSGISNLRRHMVLTTLALVSAYLVASGLLYGTATLVAACVYSDACMPEPAFRWGLVGIFVILAGLLCVLALRLETFTWVNMALQLERDAQIRTLYMDAVQTRRRIRHMQQLGAPDLQSPLQKAVQVLREIQNESKLDRRSRETLRVVLSMLLSADTLFRPAAVEKHADSETKGWLRELMNETGAETLASDARLGASGGKPSKEPRASPAAVLELARRRLSVNQSPSKADGVVPMISVQGATPEPTESSEDSNGRFNGRHEGAPVALLGSSLPPLGALGPAGPLGEAKKRVEDPAGTVGNVRFLRDLQPSSPTGVSSRIALLHGMELVGKGPALAQPPRLEGSGRSMLVSHALDTMAFDAMAFSASAGNTHTLYYMVMHLMDRYHVRQTVPALQLEKLEQWVLRVEQTYHASNPYHNHVHAADVVQAVHVLMHTERLRGALTGVERVASVLAAAVHDVAHPGITNAFLANSLHPLALRYNDRAVLENFHASTAFELMARNSGCDWFSDLPLDVRRQMRDLIVTMVMATDMGHHFDWISKLKARNAGGAWNLSQPADRKAALALTIKCADISNPVRPAPVYAKWTAAIMQEFYAQGDEEKRLGLPISMFMNRDNADVGKCQTAFIDYIVAPLFEAYSEFLLAPGAGGADAGAVSGAAGKAGRRRSSIKAHDDANASVHELLRNLKGNKEQWQRAAAAPAGSKASDSA